MRPAGLVFLGPSGKEGGSSGWWKKGGRIWKEYFEDLYNIDTQEQVAVYMCGFDGIWRGNYFRGELKGRAEVEVRVGKLKNGKAQVKMRSQKK